MIRTKEDIQNYKEIIEEIEKNDFPLFIDFHDYVLLCEERLAKQEELSGKDMPGVLWNTFLNCLYRCVIGPDDRTLAPYVYVDNLLFSSDAGYASKYKISNDETDEEVMERLKKEAAYINTATHYIVMKWGFDEYNEPHLLIERARRPTCFSRGMNCVSLPKNLLF